jgi:Secretion system C-terminal sorting domain
MVVFTEPILAKICSTGKIDPFFYIFSSANTKLMKHKLVTSLLLFLFCASFCTAQSLGFLTYTTDTIGTLNYGYDMAMGSSGEIYETGINWNNAFTGPCSLTKKNAAGNPIWQKKYACGSNTDNMYGLLVNDQSIYLCGSRSPLNLTDPTLGLVIRTDTAGNVIWERAIRTYFNGPSLVHSCFGPNGSCIAVGNVTDIQLITQGFACQFDSTGNMLWAKPIRPVGFDFSFLNDVTLFPDGTICAVGYCYNTNSLTPNPKGWIVKLDQLGNILWTKTYSMNGNASFNRVELVGADFFLTGSSETYDSINAVFYSYPLLMKIDSSGHEIWTRHYIFSQHDYAYSNEIVQLPSGNLALTAYVNDANGNTPPESLILEINSVGNCVKIIQLPPLFLGQGLALNSSNGQVLVNGNYDQTPVTTQSFLAEITPNWQAFCNFNNPVIPVDSTGELIENNAAWVEFTSTDSVLTTIPFNFNIGYARCDDFVGIQEETATFSIETFPNPATNQVQITFTNSTEDRTAELFDVNGRCVRILNIAAGTKSFSLERGELTTGMYVLRMEKANVKLIFTE